MTDHRLFAPWFLTGELTPKRVQPVRERLLSTLRARPFPLHVNVLWNTLFWDWSEESRSYEHLTSTENLIEERSPKAVDAPLPIGAFVQLKPGSQLIWGEVVYKEREVAPQDSAVCSWELAPGFLDIPADGIIRERLVLDFDTSLMPNQQSVISREISRKRMLDSYGHLVLSSHYGAHEAILDDGAFFVEYLLGHYGQEILQDVVSDLSEESKRYALLQSLQTVRDILAGIPELQSWGEYWFTRTAQAAEASLPDSEDRHASIRKAVSKLPPQQATGYHAVSLALLENYRRNSQSNEELALLSQTNYVSRIVHGNAYLRDWISATSQDSGYYTREVDVRVCGGVWRSERKHAGAAPAYAQLPSRIIIPYGHTPDANLRERTTGLMEVLNPDNAEGSVVFKSKRKKLESTLSIRDINTGQLRLGHAAEMFGSELITFKLCAPQGQVLGSTPSAKLDRDSKLLSGIDWTDAVYPGLRVSGIVQQGTLRLDCWVNVLPQPRTVDGSSSPLLWDFDDNVWYAALRASRKLSKGTLDKSTSPSDLLAAAFISAGISADDGSLVASLPDLYTAISQGPADSAPDLDFAEMLLRLLIDTPLVTELPSGLFAYVPHIVKGVSSQDITTLAVWRETPSGQKLRADVAVADSWERRFHTRRQVFTNLATWESRRESFRAAAVQDKAWLKYLRMDLPEGETYVRKSRYRRRLKPTSTTERA